MLRERSHGLRDLLVQGRQVGLLFVTNLIRTKCYRSAAIIQSVELQDRGKFVEFNVDLSACAPISCDVVVRCSRAAD